MLFVLIVLTPLFSLADRSGPGNPNGEPQLGDPPLGGGAPIGSGLGILLGLGAAYGGRKTYKLYQNNLS